MFNWQKLNIGGDLGGPWYRNVVFWWALSVVLMFGFIVVFGVLL